MPGIWTDSRAAGVLEPSEHGKGLEVSSEAVGGR